MSAGTRPFALIISLCVAGCAGNHPPLGRITRIPGSTEREGGATTDTIRPLAGHGAVPARGIVPLVTAVVPLDSTRWVGTTVDGPITFEFLVGGILRYTTATGTWTNGTWTQRANVVTFEMNDHFADYTGRIRGGRMSGTAHNRQDLTWAWEATRQ